MGAGGDADDTTPQGRIACIANARMTDGRIVVEALHVAADIGRIVNLDIARQQIEGGLIFGLGLATGRKLTYRRGSVEPARLAGLNLPRLADSPAITVDFIPGTAPPFDPGELGTAVVAPAIANALFSATGRRFRKLPFIDDPVMGAAVPTGPVQTDASAPQITPSDQIAPDGSVITDEGADSATAPFRDNEL